MLRSVCTGRKVKSRSRLGTVRDGEGRLGTVREVQRSKFTKAGDQNQEVRNVCK